jgi:endonuclease/exonuclease/phosphatase family metal-dependent hydrolase
VDLAALIGPVSPPALHVMTFNIRRRMPGLMARSADRWEARRPLIDALLDAERPTVLGVQEALPEQSHAIADALGPQYLSLGQGRRADGGGEGCPLFLDTRRMEVIRWRQIALSGTPEVAGSRSWGNLIPRIAVIAQVRERETSAALLLINTHFDHFSRRARLRAAEAIRRHVVSQGMPTVVMGDLNTGEGTLPVRTLQRDGALIDAWTAAETRLTPEWGTFPNYRAPRAGRKRIDWIAVTPDIRVERVAINATAPGGRWPSDHLPVQAVLSLPGGAA